MGALLAKEEEIVARVPEKETFVTKPLALLKREAAIRLNFIEEEAKTEEREAHSAGKA